MFRGRLADFVFCSMNQFLFWGHPGILVCFLQNSLASGCMGHICFLHCLLWPVPGWDAVVCSIQHTTFEHPDCGFPFECSGRPADVTFFSLDLFGFLGHTENSRLLLQSSEASG